MKRRNPHHGVFRTVTTAAVVAVVLGGCTVLGGGPSLNPPGATPMGNASTTPSPVPIVSPSPSPGSSASPSASPSPTATPTPTH